MKKVTLLIIFSIVCTSAVAGSNEFNNFLKKPILNTSTLDISNKGLGVPGSKCEAVCQSEFYSCMNQPGPVPWSQCYGEYTMCLFGGPYGDGCYGI